MSSALVDLKKQKLFRLSNQLTSLEALLHMHPLSNEKLTVLQTTLKYLNLQTGWSSTGTLARLLITTQTALKGYQASKSATGIMGSSFDKFQQAAAVLMQTGLEPNTLGKSELLAALNQIIAFGLIYIITQTLGNWRSSFPQQDPGASRKAGMLFRELGLLFLLSSNFISHLFKSIAQGLELNEKNQQSISHIGLFQVLLMIIILTEDANRKDEELIDSIHRFMIPTLDSIEDAISQAYSQRKLDDELLSTANTQLQLMRLALDKHDIVSLQQALENGIESLGLSYQALKDDLKRMTGICDQVSLSFSNIFNPNETIRTSMTQAA